jgi:antitoxin VapB
MNHIAKIFMTGRSQAVRIPTEFRFDVSEVYISRDELTGNVVLSARPNSWSGLFDLDASEVPADFMTEADRQQGRAHDPFDAQV